MRPLLKWGASLGLLAAAFALLDWRALVESATRLTPWGFVAAVILASTPTVPMLVRWYLLASGEGGWYVCSARYLYANLLNAVSPGNLGGDAYRFLAFRTEKRSDAALVAILVRERLLGLASMLIGLLAGAAAMEMAASHPNKWLARSLGVAAVAGLMTLALLPWIVERVAIPELWRSRLHSALSIRPSRGDAALVGWSLGALALWIATVQFVGVRLGLQIPWPVLLAVVTSVELVRIVPVTVQGLGLREGAFATLFGAFGYAHEDGFVLGAAVYLALSVALVATGIVGALMLARRGASS